MPVIVAPVEGSALIINAETRFEWRPAERATHYDFHLFNRQSGDIQRYYQRELSSSSVCSQDICTVLVSVALPYLPGHAWRVRAGNHVGKSTWTRTTFTMVNGGVGPRLE